MTSINLNRSWWEHLAPKPMHSYLKTLSSCLRVWCRTPYGAHWLEVANRENGVMRLQAGDSIPVFHLIQLGHGTPFVAPQQRMREGHRTVQRDGLLGSGIPLDTNELVVRPEIRVDFVTDPALIACAHRGDVSLHIPGVRQPSQVFSLPASYLLSPSVFPHEAYVLYQHIFGEGASYPNDGLFYVGVTTRNWQKRWREHMRAVETGSPLLFHSRFREESKAQRITYIHHKVMNITSDIEALYEAEEFLVNGHWHDQRRLNMIPGGKSGLKYLRDNGLLLKGEIPEPDDRDLLLQSYLENHPRKGLPAPWVSERWKDDAWAIAQICGRKGRLSEAQVQAIRELSAEHSSETIASRIGARNKEQVQRVIDGETYTRVS